MPFFDSKSPLDEIIERATDGSQDTEDWSRFMDICDKVAAGKQATAKEVLKSIRKRLNNRDPHVVMLALSLLDACMINGGTAFRREVCSREVINELYAKCTCVGSYTDKHNNNVANVQSTNLVAERARVLVKKWMNEFKKDASLSLLTTLYKQLKDDGYDFPEGDGDANKKPTAVARAPTDAATSEREAQELAKAIEESLKLAKAQESVTKPPPTAHTSTTASAYPSMSTAVTGPDAASVRTETAGVQAQPPSRVVKALYDFEAAEDNELTFKAGELITVTDDSDTNWWRGENARGTGLFPTSFVTGDLSLSSDAADASVAGDSAPAESVAGDTPAQVTTTSRPVTIDESELDACHALLQDLDPTDASSDPVELPPLEERCLQQAPLVDAELARLDKEHNALAAVDMQLRDALALYDSAIQSAQPMKTSAQQAWPAQAYPTASMPATYAQPQPQQQQSSAAATAAAYYAQHSAPQYAPAAMPSASEYGQQQYHQQYQQPPMPAQSQQSTMMPPQSMGYAPSPTHQNYT